MKQKYLFLFLLMGLKIFSQTNSFVASTCIGTSTGSQARMYTPVVADFDGDSDKDIIVCDESGVYFKFTNNGSNVFTSSTIFPGLSAYTAIAGKDMDNDGDIDVVSVTGKVFINNGSGTFTQLAGTFFTATGSIGNFKIADFNGDGKQDILWLNATQNSSTNKNQVWVNNGTIGSANFVLASEFDTLGIYNNGGAVVGDIDNDNDIDLVNCGQGGWNGKVYKNNGSGTFTESQTLPTYTGTGFMADWDKDGDTDFLAYDYYNNFGLHVWLNDGTGTFGTLSASILAPISNSSGNGQLSKIIDLNGDTWLDAVYTTSNGARYYINTGCQLVLNGQVLSNSWNGSVVEDFTNDGKPDLFFAARDAQSCLFINDLNIQTYVPITAPTATTQINYTVGQTASPLTASGSNLLWYTAATGGTGSATAPTPSTAAVGTTSYWVSSTNSNGCESNRVQINVTVALPATHLNFDGSNDFVNLGTSLSTALNGTTALTLEAWINPSVLNGWNNIITDYDSAYHKVLLRVRNNNNIQFWLNGNAYNSSFTVPLNTWTHIAAVWNGTNVYIYANGNLISTQAASLSLPVSTNQFNIGSKVGGTEYFTGNIDEVRVWNVARTAEQINGSKNCELQGTESGLLAYYKFNQGDDQGTNTSITSLTATTGSNGTLTNFALTGATSNWLAGSPVTTGSIIPGNATVTTPIIYAQGATASALTATTGTNGTGLLWYTAATGGTGSTTAPTPSTATLGSTTYYVSSTNANGCESARTPIVVNVNGPATHLNFDGTNDSITFGTSLSSSLIGSNFLTAEAWINIPNVSGIKTIVGNHVGSGQTQFNFRIVNNTLNAFLGDGYYVVSSAAGTIAANTWTHVAMVYNDTTLKLYINGVEVGSTNVPAFYSLANTSPLCYIGNSVFGGEIFSGNLDEVRVWNVARTVDQLNANKNCELQGNESGLVRYYKFNQGVDQGNNASVTSATDSTSNANNGTLANFALMGSTSNWLSGSPVTTGSVIPGVPTVSTPVNYAQGATASPLTATTGTNGTGLLWYTAATGGIGSTTAPTPSTAAVGTTSYWVSSTNSNGCESNRVQINVTVALPATHLNFDGSNDFVSCGNILPSSYTKEAWVYITNASLKNNFISGGDLDGQHAFWAPNNYGNRLSSGHNTTWNHVQDPTPLNLNTWYHVAVTYDAATSTMKLYKNGVLVSTNTSVPAFINGNTVRLGAFNNANNLLMGNLDEVRIWNTALSQIDIVNKMNCELQGTESGLIAYYKFNQGADAVNNSTVTTLIATTGTNGTLTNFTLNGATSNWLAGSPVITGSVIPGTPTVTTPVNYNQGDTATALTATTGTNGTGLMWYTTATGGTGSVTAPTPSTATAGTTSYWVASINANGCESSRIEIQVVVTASATHLHFDGTNDFVISANQVTTNTENQTYQAWFKIPSIPTNDDRILQRGSDGSGGWSASLGVSSTGKLNGAISAVTEDYLTGTTTLIPNTWYLATLVFENNNSIRLYLNGNLEASVTIVNRTLRNSDNKLRIGSGNIASEYFNGEIDEVRVWNSALTLTDITNTMNCELQASQTNLKIYYKLNQGLDNSNNSSVTTATDSSGNTNNGTLTNFALTGATSNWKAGSTITTGNACATLEAANFDSVSTIAIYPNPTSSIFNVSIKDTAKVEIYDMVGKLILNTVINSTSNQIDVSNLNTGMYLVNINVDGVISNFKLIKK